MSDTKKNDSMTLRDQFAMAALQGCLAYSHVNPASGNYHENCSVDGAAGDAYKFADAMLAARSPAPSTPAAYDKTFGDDRACQCGHPYGKHFDWADSYAPGCKYCDCMKFVEATAVQSTPVAQLPPGYTLPAGYEYTGEIRCPKNGEHYVDDWGVQLARQDFWKSKYPILRPIAPLPQLTPEELANLRAKNTPLEQWPEVENDAFHVNAFAPLPWLSDNAGKISDAKGGDVGECWGAGCGQKAALIVRAVNSHEALVAACNEARQMIGHMTGEWPGTMSITAKRVDEMMATAGRGERAIVSSNQMGLPVDADEYFGKSLTPDHDETAAPP